jgi:hypothetical protein
MRIGREGNFAVQYALRRLPAQEFARDEFDVFGRANAGRDCQVDFDEMWEVCEPVPSPQAFDSCGGQRHAVAFCEQKQGLRLDRAFQVNVQFDLRHAADECIE